MVPGLFLEVLKNKTGIISESLPDSWKTYVGSEMVDRCQCPAEIYLIIVTQE